MPFLTKDQIKRTVDFRTSEVSIPEWGENAKVMVRELSSSEAEYYSVDQLDNDGNIVMSKVIGKRVRVIRFATIDPETMEPIFSKADEDWLSKKSNAVIMRISDAILKLSGMTTYSMEDDQKNE